MQNDTTGRDRHITVKALAYAIGAIQALPPEQQEWSDLQDMIAVLRTRCPNGKEQDFWADTVERHLGYRPVFVDEKAAEVLAFPQGSRGS